MGYVNSAPYFCITTETVVDLVDFSMNSCHMSPTHTLELSVATLTPAYFAPKPTYINQWAYTPPEQ